MVSVVTVLSIMLAVQANVDISGVSIGQIEFVLDGGISDSDGKHMAGHI